MRAMLSEFGDTKYTAGTSGSGGRSLWSCLVSSDAREDGDPVLTQHRNAHARDKDVRARLVHHQYLPRRY